MGKEFKTKEKSCNKCGKTTTHYEAGGGVVCKECKTFTAGYGSKTASYSTRIMKPCAC